MKKYLTILFFLILLLSPNLASAKTLIAVCKNPEGKMFGQEGILGKKQTVDKKDRLKGEVKIIWNTEKNETAQIIFQNPYGGKPILAKGICIHASGEQLSFIVNYPQAAWLYSLFPSPGILLMTQHTNGLSTDTGGAISKTLKAKCDISFE